MGIRGGVRRRSVKFKIDCLKKKAGEDETSRGHYHDIICRSISGKHD